MDASVYLRQKLSVGDYTDNLSLPVLDVHNTENVNFHCLGYITSSPKTNAQNTASNLKRNKYPIYTRIIFSFAI